MSETLRILLLEGNSEDARRVVDAVQAGGLRADFHHHQSGDDLEALLSGQAWDLILCNFHFGDISALDLLVLVRRQRLDLPVIVLSDGIGEELAVTVMHAGAHDYISKANLSRLVPAIERELEELAIHRQHQQAQAALRESEVRFRQLTENIGEVFWLLDVPSGRMVYLSPAFETVWDRSREGVMEEPGQLLGSVHPEDYHRVKQLLDEYGWAGFSAEYRIQLQGGDSRWIATQSFPVRDERGRLSRVAGLSIDVTERHRLTGEREMMSRALEQSADAVMITDARGSILYVNAAFEEVTGYSRKEALGRTPNFLKSGFQDRDFYRQVWENLTTGLPFTDIFINRRKDGELYYEAKTITPVRGANGELTHFVSTGKDITERLKTRERLQRLVHFDAVTGLANSNLLMERLEQALIHAGRRGSQLGVMCVGLELAGLLGDIQQKRTSEILLHEVAQRLSGVAQSGTTVARLGVDEFVLLVKDVAGPEELERQAKALVLAFAEPLKSGGYELFLTPHVGISLFPADANEGGRLIELARAAMRQVPPHGERMYAFYRAAPDKHLSS
ncbi:MAG: PAS domain S-box protein [Pseudomonadota bacterium]